MKNVILEDYKIYYPDDINEEEFAVGTFTEIFTQKIYGQINKDDVIIDCGSNLGLFTLYSLNNGANKVISIDPSIKIINSFQVNCYDGLLNNKVIFYNKALWNESNLKLNLDPYYFSAGSHIVEETSNITYLVDSITIDDIVSEQKLSKVDLIKMDIEGAEENALLGARETIIRFKPKLAISLYHKTTSTKDIHDILKSFNVAFSEEIIIHKNPCPNSNEARVFMAVGHYNFQK